MRPYNFEGCRAAKGEPPMFPIPTDIDKKFLGDQIATLITYQKDFFEKVKGWKPFHGDPDCKITPKGLNLPSSSSSSSAQPRFVTISREIRALFPSLLSLVYTELAFSMMYLVFRKNETEFLVEMTGKIPGELKSDKTEREKRAIVRKWIDRLHLYVDRHSRNPIVENIKSYLPTLSNVIESSNYKTFYGSFQRVQNLLMEAHNGTKVEKLQTDKLFNTILMKTDDFCYPLGMSFFEWMYRISRNDGGFEVFARECEEYDSQIFMSNYKNIRVLLEKKIREDVTRTFLPHLASVEIIQNKIECTQKLVCAISKVMSDFIFFCARKFFFYGLSATDHTSGTTVNWKVFNIILLQHETGEMCSVNQAVVECIREIVVSYLKK